METPLTQGSHALTPAVFPQGAAPCEWNAMA